MRRVVILGVTGSIGRQALDVVKRAPGEFRVVGVAAGSDRAGLEAAAAELGAEHTALGAAEAAELAALPEADVVLNGIVGAAGLQASVAALAAGKTLALANKESLVAGGELCLAAAASGGGAIVPVDSEHSALAHCLAGRDRSEVARLVLTASGGPFRDRTDLAGVTRDEALAHPTWSMGPRITIDSATMMNKGFEVIEAHHLFGMEYEQIAVVVHPESVVHGIVELVDGSMLMEAAPPDMRLPIAAALSHPARRGPAFASLDLAAGAAMTFEAVDHSRFPAVSLAYDAGRAGYTYPAVLNAADEVAVGAFLDGAIAFDEIVPAVRRVIEEHEPVAPSDLGTIMEVDAWARRAAQAVVAGAAA